MHLSCLLQSPAGSARIPESPYRPVYIQYIAINHLPGGGIRPTPSCKIQKQLRDYFGILHNNRRRNIIALGVNFTER